MTIDFPDGFLWGTATAAHQIEGGNWNNDWWAWEHAPGTAVRRAVGRRVRPLLALPATTSTCSRDLGFGAYRFSLEWSRIEPEDGECSTRRARPLPRGCSTRAANAACSRS